jgi:glycosyltransferase involved in cell wall biosynthesis
MARRIRILHILPSMRGYGAERQIMDLLSVLGGPNVEAGVLTIYTPTEEERSRFQFTVLDAGRHGRGDYAFLPRLVAQIRKFNPHIVHTHTHVGKYWGRLGAILAGVRTIVHTEHNPCDPRRNVLERLADWVLHQQTACVVTFFSEQRRCLAETESLPAEKIAIIPNGLRLAELACSDRESARKRLHTHPGEISIFFIGRMEFQKNHRLALQTLAAMEGSVRKNVVLYFAGTGVEEPALRALARELDVEERVRFLGYRGDIPQILPAADLLLMTSWFEGMPLTLIEAMAAGVPIVTTPWIGANSMLAGGRFGFLTPGWEPRTVAAEIERALAHPGARTAMAQRAQQYVLAECDLEHMAEAHRRLYARLAGPNVA